MQTRFRLFFILYPDAPYEFTSRVYTSERITIWRFVGHIEALGAYRGDGEFIPFSEYPKELHFKDDKLAEVIYGNGNNIDPP